MKLFTYTLLILVFVSCRKDVTIKLPDYQQKVVVEGFIETGSTAVVFLSYSVPYFGDFDYSTPQEAFIKGAFVTLSDGITIDTLKEIDPNSLPSAPDWVTKVKCLPSNAFAAVSIFNFSSVFFSSSFR